MKQGMRAMAGAVALAGLLATAGPAVAKDRVIAVDGVSKANADRRVEILVHVPDGRGRERRRRARAGGAGREEGAEAARAAAVELVLVHGPVLGHLPGRRRTTTRPASRSRGRADRARPTRCPTGAPSRAPTSGSRSAATTTRCPSLVRECPGAQRNDRFNDVGWAQLQNGTLGVTWSTSGTDEADMAINTRYAWTTGCTRRLRVVRPRVGLSCTRTATSPGSATRPTPAP